MNSIEQAREALIQKYAEGSHRSAPYVSGAPLSVFRQTFSEFADELASLSPTTPVDGVGAEPRVKQLEWTEVTSARSDEDPTPEHTGDYEAATPFGTYYIEQYFGSDSYGWNVTINGYDPVADKDDPEDAKAAAQADYERRVLSALASPEAEARLRERDEALTVLRDHHRWHIEAGELGLPDGEGGWIAIDLSAEYGDSRLYERTAPLVDLLPPEHKPMPRAGAGSNHWENWVLAVRRLKAAERRAEAAEARLAQAEGGPAVTEAMVEAACLDRFGPNFYNQDDDFQNRSRGERRRWLEAALHPQSAAGEEGKP